jgi:HK97 family phage major capsid protein
MADIHVKTNEPLHRLTDLVEKAMDTSKRNIETLDGKINALREDLDPSKFVKVEDLKEVRESLVSNDENLKDVRARLEKLDELLPTGNKVFKPIVASESDKEQFIREDIARGMLNLSFKARGMTPQVDCQWIKRSGQDVSGYGVVQVEATGSTPLADGGYLMPVEYYPVIGRIMEQYGVARRLFRRVKMNHREWEQPTNSDLPTVYWDTEITGPGGTPAAGSALEGYAPAQSGVTFAKPKMTAHKLIALDSLSMEVDQDAIPSLRDFLLEVFLMAITKEEDTAAFTQATVATKPFTGLLYEGAITEVTGAANTFLGSLIAGGATGGFNSLIAVQDAVDETVADSAVWIMSNSVLNAVRQVKDVNERPLFSGMTEAGGLQLFGRPIVRSRVFPKVKDGGNQASDPFILYGDMGYKIFGDRMQLSVDVSEHAAFKEAGLVMRWMERISYLTLIKSAFARMKCSA